MPKSLAVEIVDEFKDCPFPTQWKDVNFVEEVGDAAGAIKGGVYRDVRTGVTAAAMMVHLPTYENDVRNFVEIGRRILERLKA